MDIHPARPRPPSCQVSSLGRCLKIRVRTYETTDLGIPLSIETDGSLLRHPLPPLSNFCVRADLQIKMRQTWTTPFPVNVKNPLCDVAAAAKFRKRPFLILTACRLIRLSFGGEDSYLRFAVADVSELCP